jgi:outer membrane protein
MAKNKLISLAINLLVASIFELWFIPVQAADLTEVYQQALSNDAVLARANAVKASSQEILPQSRANLLPNLNLNANSTNNHLRREQEGQAAVTTKGNSNGYSVSLSQPIFNASSWFSWRQAQALATKADYDYLAAKQDLIIRTTKAYCAVLLATDKLQFIQTQKAAITKQLQNVQAKYQVGLETKTSVDEAQAGLDAILAQEIAAQNVLTNSYEQLQIMTGKRYDSIIGFVQTIPLQAPQPIELQAWLESAKQNNVNLQAARLAQQAAKQNIRSNLANHLPNLNVVGNYQEAQGAFSNTMPGTRANNQLGTIGFQLSLPLYSGGAIQSKVRQAEADYQAAGADYEIAYRKVIADTTQSYNTVLADISKLNADKQAIISSQSALASTEASFKVGTRTLLDVLSAQQALVSAKTIFAEDEYAYIIDTLQLKQLAGRLTETDLLPINSWLHDATG